MQKVRKVPNFWCVSKPFQHYSDAFLSYVHTEHVMRILEDANKVFLHVLLRFSVHTEQSGRGFKKKFEFWKLKNLTFEAENN